VAGREGRAPTYYSPEEWAQLLVDPVREELRARGEAPDLDRIRALFPPTAGDPAFDARAIARGIDRLETEPTVDTGHPFLDLSVKTGLAHIDLTFQGDHPKYGVKRYAESIHDGFPPTIIAAVDALSAWGLHARAAQLFRYWLTHFVRDDGTIDYYGPSISEYGMLLATAALLLERAGGQGWWEDGFPALDRMARHLLRLRAEAEKADGLLSGVPEADTRKDVGKYFHNNAWAAKGLSRWAEACGRASASPATSAPTMRDVASGIARDTLAAIARTWPQPRAAGSCPSPGTRPDAGAGPLNGAAAPQERPRSLGLSWPNAAGVPRSKSSRWIQAPAGQEKRGFPEDWWLPPQVEPVARPEFLTASTLGSYTNYRYWPELLSSGLLPSGLADRVVASRLRAGGQFCGMTRLGSGLDDWPLAEYLTGLQHLGRREDFLLSLYGHVAYHQAGGHLTAYEQISAPPCRERAPYCLPAQLVAARAARLLVEEEGPAPGPSAPRDALDQA